MKEGDTNIVDHIINGDVVVLVNTPRGQKSQFDDYAIRRAAITHKLPYLTTMSATSAACDAVIALKSEQRAVRSVQERIASLNSSIQST